MSVGPTEPLGRAGQQPGRLMSNDKLTSNIAGLTINSPANIYPLYLNSAQYRDSRVGERSHYGLRNANPGIRCELR